MPYKSHIIINISLFMVIFSIIILLLICKVKYILKCSVLKDKKQAEIEAQRKAEENVT